MSSVCLKEKCIECCRKTNMLLTYQDIKKIEGLGYQPSSFLEDHDGWLQLKNSEGRCVFHTGERCRIYNDRPRGCSLYPVVYDADHGRVILDRECPQRLRFSLGSDDSKKLKKLVSTLRRERSERRKRYLITNRVLH